MRFLLAIISCCLLMSPQQSYAKSFVYLIGNSWKMARLDTSTNEVTYLPLKVPADTTLDTVLEADVINNNLYMTHCARRGLCKIGVYGLKTLDFIKELPFISMKSDIQLLIYPDGSKLLINYLLPIEGEKDGGYTIDLYDAKTLTEIKNLKTFLGMYRVMFSKDGKKIYSVIGGDEAKVDIIDSETFELIASKDLTQVWRKRPEVFSSGIENYGSGKIVVFENLQAEKKQQSKLDLFVYDIESGASSKRISTGLQGEAKIIDDGSRLIFDENEDVRDNTGHIMKHKSLGKLHVYDVTTAQELGVITFQPKGQGRIQGVNPSGDKLYYQSEGDTSGTAKITVIDIKNFSVLTIRDLSFEASEMIFLEE